MEMKILMDIDGTNVGGSDPMDASPTANTPPISSNDNKTIIILIHSLIKIIF